GVVLPDAPVRVVVGPISGDNTARIQAAVDYVSQLPADEHGLRGAVLLTSGRHLISGSLAIRAGGVVLRGQGSGEEGTTLVASGTDRRPLVRIFGKNDRQPVGDRRAAVVGYAPVGAVRLRLENTGSFNPGDAIVVERPSTAQWIQALGMEIIGAPKAGFKWLP